MTIRNYEQCKVCGQWGYMPHKCPPVWEVFMPDYGDEDEADLAHGEDEEIAVGNYAALMFERREHPIDMEIWSRKDETEEWHKWNITVEDIPSFEITRRIP